MIIIRLIVVHNTMKFGATQLICHEFSVNFHFLNHAHAIQFVGPLVKGRRLSPIPAQRLHFRFRYETFGCAAGANFGGSEELGTGQSLLRR